LAEGHLGDFKTYNFGALRQHQTGSRDPKGQGAHDPLPKHYAPKGTRGGQVTTQEERLRTRSVTYLPYSHLTKKNLLILGSGGRDQRKKDLFRFHAPTSWWIGAYKEQLHHFAREKSDQKRGEGPSTRFARQKYALT